MRQQDVHTGVGAALVAALELAPAARPLVQEAVDTAAHQSLAYKHQSSTITTLKLINVQNVSLYAC